MTGVLYYSLYFKCWSFNKLAARLGLFTRLERVRTPGSNHEPGVTVRNDHVGTMPLKLHIHLKRLFSAEGHHAGYPGNRNSCPALKYYRTAVEAVFCCSFYTLTDTVTKHNRLTAFLVISYRGDVHYLTSWTNAQKSAMV